MGVCIFNMVIIVGHRIACHRLLSRIFQNALLRIYIQGMIYDHSK